MTSASEVRPYDGVDLLAYINQESYVIRRDGTRADITDITDDEAIDLLRWITKTRKLIAQGIHHQNARALSAVPPDGDAIQNSPLCRALSRKASMT